MEYRNVVPSDRLDAGAYYRLVLRRGRLLGIAYPERAWMDAVKAIHEKLAATGIGFPITRTTAGPGQSEVPLEVRAPLLGTSATVGELVARVQQIGSTGGSQFAEVALVERIGDSRTGTTARAADTRKALDAVAASSPKGLGETFGDLLERAQSVGKWFAAVVVLALVALVLYFVARVRKST